MYFQRADFEQFRTLAGRVMWESVQKGKEVQEGWMLLKKEIFKVQEQTVHVCHKISRWGRPAWLNREHLLSLWGKNRDYVQWKKE